jgi:transcriptional regulator with XRE-family HTH domain
MRKYAALMKVGQHMRQAREKLGISQEELALRANVDRTYVGGVERGERNLGVLNLLKIAKALETSASEILKGVITNEGR